MLVAESPNRPSCSPTRRRWTTRWKRTRYRCLTSRASPPSRPTAITFIRSIAHLFTCHCAIRPPAPLPSPIKRPPSSSSSPCYSRPRNAPVATAPTPRSTLGRASRASAPAKAPPTWSNTPRPASGSTRATLVTPS